MIKKIPLSLAEPFEESKKKYSFLIDQVSHENFYYWFKDKDPNSDFLFSISKGNSYLRYKLEIKPVDENSVLTIPFNNVALDQVLAKFDKWIKIIERYNKLNSMDSDPIVQWYKVQYSEVIKPQNPEERFEDLPFKTKDDFLKKLDLCSKTLIDKKNEIDSSNFREIFDEINDLKEKVNELNIGETANKTSSIFAKIRRIGINIFYNIIGDGRGWFVGKFLDESLSNIPDLF